MVRTLAASIRNYRPPAVATPRLVLGAVVCEMLIPLVPANLLDTIKDGATVSQILPTAGVLVAIALVSLLFGAAAGVTCSYGGRARCDRARLPALRRGGGRHLQLRQLRVRQEHAP